MLCGHRRHEQRCPDQAAGRKTGYEEKWRRGGPISGQPVIIYHGESTITHDGEGRIVKEDWEKDYIYNGNPTSGWDTTSRSIYSTVLGGEIASIEENFYGVMEKTRVYAGGAVIGEQQRWTATGQSTGETYSHIFRDPVSGSVIRGGLEEHYEPLGQKIDPVPPLEDPTFPGPNDGFNDARFPEWQCQAAAARHLSGSELPAHCQRAAEQRNIAAKIDVTWPAWPEKDGNALKPADSPLFNGAGGNHASLSFATRTMSASLTTTAKRLTDDKDDPECGTKDCIVTVTADLDLPEDFKDASVSGDFILDGDHSKAQQLPQCLRDFLRPFFPKIQVGNWTTVSPVDDARFVPGLPFYVNGKTTSAVTLGLYDIHYDSGQVDLTGGLDKSSIGIIAEELAHSTQFIAIWNEQALKHGTSESYRLAQGTWQGNYLGESGKIIAKNIAKATLSTTTGITLPQQDSYRDNKYEKAAQATRATVQATVDKLAKSPCYP